MQVDISLTSSIFMNCRRLFMVVGYCEILYCFFLLFFSKEPPHVVTLVSQRRQRIVTVVVTFKAGADKAILKGVSYNYERSCILCILGAVGKRYLEGRTTTPPPPPFIPFLFAGRGYTFPT